MLVVRCRIRISGVTRCSHRCVFYVSQLQPIITDTLDSRICNNLVDSGITSGSLRVTRPTAVLLPHLQVVMQGSRMTHKMMICMHEWVAFVSDYHFLVWNALPIVIDRTTFSSGNLDMREPKQIIRLSFETLSNQMDFSDSLPPAVIFSLLSLRIIRITNRARIGNERTLRD
jgi:hypothetical protein